ncbi:hypothetical protein [Agrococcus beijingensis]|uniref:hypothetical protein n=1 Tax=Agrococcus beijingensis TaxID=3068634 RepID=UPI0027416094|nr:hypothetical protein [Agrococcus sp. REN33]
MSLVAPVPKRIRTRETVLGIAALLALPLILLLPPLMLQGVGPITAESACPAVTGPAGCTPKYAEQVLGTIALLRVVAPVLAAITLLVAAVLILRGRRSWPTAVLGAVLTAAAVLGHVEIATQNASVP